MFLHISSISQFFVSEFFEGGYGCGRFVCIASDNVHLAFFVGETVLNPFLRNLSDRNIYSAGDVAVGKFFFRAAVDKNRV